MHVYAQSIQVTLPIRRCDHNRAAFPHSVKQRAKDDGITDIRHVELVEAQQRTTFPDHVFCDSRDIRTTFSFFAYGMQSLVHLKHKLVKVSPALLLDRSAVEKNVHYEGLSTSHAAIQVQTSA